ncbi:glycosyltransferase family 2 protein [Williamsia serinedens]|uniref:glycosyltransferase family 2 protein n=1 Tax=Williamsia serinedens TaxID=391736 RepID=UPI0020A5F493|nr:glycosyltransferase family A protein [Williamsia serinedens]
MTDVTIVMPVPISIVIPAYNEGSAVRACLERASAQGPDVAEIVVVDNNSTDDTADHIRSAAEHDDRIRLVSEPRAGVAFARYTGFSCASQDLIASVDCDTILDAGWAGAITRVMDTHPEVVAGTGPMVMHDLPFQNRYRRRNNRLQARAEAALAAGGPLRVPALSGANSVIRAGAWKEIQDDVSHRPDLFEDLDRSLLLHARGHDTVLIPGMTATVSGRRLLSGPASFIRYAACGPRTYAHHGKWGMAVLATAVNTLALVRTMTLLPANRAWDPDRECFSLGRMFGRGITIRASPIG